MNPKCGYDRCITAFDFHHVDAREKDFTISDRMTSWKVIRSELDRCVLLCANCHREVHDGLLPGFLADDADRGFDLDGPDFDDPTLGEDDVPDLLEDSA